MRGIILTFVADFVIAAVIGCTAMEVLLRPALWPLAAAVLLVAILQITGWHIDIATFLRTYPIKRPQDQSHQARR
ncbi:MAG TPA: hypothetical protein VLG38_01415 [Gammaproteobacteria bacterium]|nr:hypothetical protein [Gammaproteobacteria bacterium]